MDFTHSRLMDLLQDDSECCISLFMPMTVAGRERSGNRVRFKNLIRDAEELMAHARDAEDANGLAKALHELHDDEHNDLWQHPTPGLALFCSAQRCEIYSIPHEANEEVHVGNRYYVRPMLRLLQGDGRFYLLAVSQNLVRLFAGSRAGIVELRPTDLPSSLADALNVDEWTSTLQFHSQSRGGRDEAMFHGQGAGEDDRKQELLEFFHRLDAALANFLAEHSEPLAFAGVDYLFPIFQQACSYRLLVQTPLVGSPDRMSAEELHREAWTLVAPHFQTKLDAAIQRVANASGADRGTADLAQVLTAAQAGGVDALLIRADESRWGEIDGGGEIRIHESHEEQSIDLVDEAAFRTLKTGGEVWVVEGDRLPPQADAVAALLRYPLPSSQQQ